MPLRVRSAATHWICCRSNRPPRPSFHRSPESPRGHKESLDRSSSSFLHAFVDSSFRVRAFSRRETAGITRLPSTPRVYPKIGEGDAAAADATKDEVPKKNSLRI